MFLIFAVVNNIKFNMKKIFLTTIIMVLAAALAQAGDITRQPLLQVGKVWNYDYSWVDISFQRNSGSARIWVEDETLIALTSCSMDGECIFTREDFSTQAYRITDGIFLPTAQTADPKENPIHDLQGRRLNGIPQKGIYIRNGKKHVR